MEKVIIAFADKNAAVFKPVFAEFSVAEETVKAYYLKGDKAMIEAARVMLGLDASVKYIIGTLWNTPEYPDTPDQFFANLRKRWEEVQKPEAVSVGYMIFGMDLVDGTVDARFIPDSSPDVATAKANRDYRIDRLVSELKQELSAPIIEVYALTKTFSKEQAKAEFLRFCAMRLAATV